MATNVTGKRLMVRDLAAELKLPVTQIVALAQQVGSSATQSRDRLGADEAEAIRAAALTDSQAPSARPQIIEVVEPASARTAADHLLSGPELQETLARLGNTAQRIASEQINGMSGASFDKQLVASSSDLDARLIDVELKGVLAKHGLTPLDTIEGLTKLREFLVAAYRDTHTVDPEVQLKVMQLQVDIQKIETSRSTVVLSHQHAEQLKLLQVQTQQQVEQAKAGATVATAHADSHVERVRAQGKSRSADIDQDLMDDVKRTETIKKKIANRRERQRTIWREAVKPKIKLAVLVAIPLILVSNLVADGPGNEDTFVLGTVNSMWDAIYMPLRDGVIRTIEGFTD